MGPARRLNPARGGAPRAMASLAACGGFSATNLLSTAPSTARTAARFRRLQMEVSTAMFEKQQAWAREHIILNNVHHAAGAFGLAIVLQHYLAGNPFLPVAVGWVLLGFTVAMHLYQFTR